MIRALWPSLLLCSDMGCSRAPVAHSMPAPPATVAHPVGEADLTQVVLRPEAERRLGIATHTVGRQQLPRTRAYGATAEIPMGWRITLAAPFAAQVMVPAGGMVAPGARVAAGHELLRLRPLLSVERSVPTPAEDLRRIEAQASLAAGRAEAEGALERALVEADAAARALARAERLAAEQAASARTVEECRARLAGAEASVKASRARHAVFSATALTSQPAADPASRELCAPFAGVLLSLAVASGQAVQAGAPLCELADDSTLWLKVAVPDNEALELDVTAPAEVAPFPAPLALASTPAPVLAAPVLAPPGVDPGSGAVLVYYALLNPEGRHRPGQRLLCHLRTNAVAEVLTAPHRALVVDVHGGTWVYVVHAPGVFVRTRVRVDRVVQDTMVLAAGVTEGARVVTAGAAELFGTEFGVGK